MPIDAVIREKDQLQLYSLEQELGRALEAYNAIQTRINTVISLSVTMTVAFIGIQGAILKFAETSSAWKPVADYLPWAGLISMIIAWRIARALRRELIQILKEANAVEEERGSFVSVPVRPFSRRLREELSYFGMNRETYVLLIIALGWAAYLAHAHNVAQWAQMLLAR